MDIETKQPAVSNPLEHVVMWIDCKEKEPTGVSNNYLAYRPSATGSKVCSLWFDPQHNGWSGNFKVTHWALLPKGPLST